MQIKSFIGILLLLFLLTACVDEYWPDVDRYERLLVIDGMITNAPGPYEIRLSLSAPARQPSSLPLKDCAVSILDDAGASELLHETTAGLYITDTNGIRGMVGRKYKLVVIRPDERVYETPFELLQQPTEIDAIYAEVEHKADNNYYHELSGLRFYLDSKEAVKDTNYFMWRLEATYQYQSDFTIRWYYDGTLHWFHGPDSLYNCWKTYPINTFFLQTTRSLIRPLIKRLPLHFVNTETRLLSVRYSIMARQYALNEAAYNYWEKLKEMNTEQGSLYTQQPYQTRGNLQNLHDETETVLGFFLVAGVAEKRIFVDRPNMLPFYYPNCVLNDRDFEAYGMMGMEDPVYYPIYAIETPGGRRAVPHPDCVDCRRHGGSINKPAFWID